MHTAAFRALGMDDWSYELLPVDPEGFARRVAALPGEGFFGANVTIPHKQAALGLASEASPAARAIGAANTLSFDGHVVAADNTDAPGFLAALEDRAPATALVLGAGGSARAVVHALASIDCDVAIWNRTRRRAQELGRAVDAPVAAELLVNCTSLGLGDPSTDFKALPVSADSLGTYATVVDLVYRQGADTELIAHARAAGCSVVDGLEILVRQGALSFEIWTDRPAPLDAMRAGARALSDEPRDPISAPSEPGRRRAGEPGG